MKIKVLNKIDFDNVDVLALVKKHVRNYEIRDDKALGRCPFHNDENPSFAIVLKGEKKGLWNCFCCGGGNIYTFIKRLNVNKKDITLSYGEETEEQIEFYIPKFPKAIKSNKINDFLLYIREYVNRCRKPHYFVEKMIKLFKMRVCVRGVYKDKLLIPFFSKNKRYLGFAAQDMNDRSVKLYNFKAPLKYILFGKNLINGDKRVILVEGLFDWIYLATIGIPAITTLTTNVSKYQLDALKKYEKVYICFDADEAGVKHARQIKKMLGKRAVLLNLGKGDPDEYRVQWWRNKWEKIKKI